MSFSGPASASFPSGSPPVGSLSQAPRLSSGSAPPFYSVNRLGRKTGRRVALAVCLALLAHGAGAAQQLTSLHDVRTFALQVRSSIHERRIQSIEVNIEVPDQAPPPAPEPADVAPAPPTKKVIRRRISKRRAAPPPSPAQAGRVLTAEPDADEPLDLTGNTFIQGTANSYAGGVTTAKGTSKIAVRNRSARTGGVRGGRGSTVGGNLSRKARPLKKQWNCPFPSEADLDQVNYMSVPVAVVISASGRARSARAVKDPGYGFGKAAQRCAKKKRYAAARNRLGKSIGSTLVFTINFRR